MKQILVKGQCNQCGDCCREFWFCVPNRKSDKEFYHCRGFEVQERKDYIYVKVPQTCSSLLEDGKCLLHNDGKPQICKQYPFFDDKAIVENDYPITPLLPNCGYHIEVEYLGEGPSRGD